MNLSKGGKVDAQLGGDRDAGPTDMMDKDDVGKEPEDDKPKKKDKTLKKVSSEIEEKVFNSDISPDNDEFEEKNKNFVPKGTKIKKDLSNPPPPYKLPKELENLAKKKINSFSLSFLTFVFLIIFSRSLVYFFPIEAYLCKCFVNCKPLTCLLSSRNIALASRNSL